MGKLSPPRISCILAEGRVIISGCGSTVDRSVPVTRGLSNGLSNGRGLSGAISVVFVFVFLRFSTLILTLSLWKASSTVSLGRWPSFVLASESGTSLSTILVAGVEKFHRLERKLSISLTFKSN